jgi:hypothetical protein
MNVRSIAVWTAVFVLVAAASALLAADRQYQFTGVVKSVDGKTFSVEKHKGEKNKSETWTFAIGADTKGTPNLGDKVTVYYSMIATEIEVKTAAKKSKK